MFGNHPLPNIAPSLLLFLPPPPDTFPPLPPPPFPLRPPAWAKRGRAHRQRQRPPTTPRHHRSTAPASATARLLPLPSSRDVGERHPPRHHLRKAPPPRHLPPTTTSPRHVTANNARHVTATNATSPGPRRRGG